MDNDYDALYQKKHIFDMYLARNSECCIRILGDDLINATDKLCKMNEKHCFKDAFGEIYEELKSLAEEFLRNVDIRKAQSIDIVPYGIDKTNWKVNWIASKNTYNQKQKEQHPEEDSNVLNMAELNPLSFQNMDGIYNLLQHNEKYEGVEMQQNMHRQNSAFIGH